MKLKHKVETSLVYYKRVQRNTHMCRHKIRKTQSFPQLPRDINYIKETLFNSKRTKALFLAQMCFIVAIYNFLLPVK